MTDFSGGYGDELDWASLERDLADAVATATMPEQLAPVRTMEVVAQGDYTLTHLASDLCVRRQAAQQSDGYALRYFGPLDASDPRDWLTLSYAQGKLNLHMLRDNPDEEDGESSMWLKVEYCPLAQVVEFIGYRGDEAESTKLDTLFTEIFESDTQSFEALVQFMRELE